MEKFTEGRTRTVKPSSNGVHTPPEPKLPPRLNTRTISNIMPRVVRYEWRGRIPVGMLTIIDSDPGVGKTALSLDIAARRSSGRTMPFDDTERPAGDVLILAAEDTPEEVLRPRLQIAGADMTRIHVIDSVTVDDTEFPVLLPDALTLIEAEIVRRKVVLLIIDPIMAFLGGKVDTNDDHSSRTVLTILKQIAERTGCAILVIRHLNKRNGESAIYRGGGSIAFVAAARSAMVAGYHPDDKVTRVLATVKLNVGKRPPSVTFTIDESDGQPVVKWGEEADLTADDIVTRIIRKPGEASEEAEEFLREVLARGPMLQTDIFAAAEHRGISEKTLRRAKGKLGIGSRKGGFAKAKFEWFLLGAETDERIGEETPF